MIVEIMMLIGAIVFLWLCMDKKKAKEREKDLEFSRFGPGDG